MTTATLRAPVADRATDIVTVDTFHRPEPGGWIRHRLSRFDFALAALLFLTALVIRWPLIERGETLLHSDEAIVGIMAQDIAAGRSLPIYFYGQRYMGALEAYVIAAISPFFENPIHALRFGPACFFAIMVSLQYLMLTRWFGRRGGLIGAATLLAASPMFAQWSISARGGYIEVLTWGSALLWAYSEWFVPPVRQGKHGRRLFLFGALVGSGFWINPCVILFVAPIFVHAMLAKCRWLQRGAALGMFAFPVATVAMILCMNLIYSVRVEEGQIHSSVLMGLPLQWVIFGLAPVFFWLIRRFLFPNLHGLVDNARRTLTDHTPLIFGMLLGAMPGLIYVVQTILGVREMEPSLPLGLRPIWTTGATLGFLGHGLPMIFGADPRAFLQFVSVGRDNVLTPLSYASGGLMNALNTIGYGALVTALIVLIVSYRREIGDLLRLVPRTYSPTVLASLGIVIGCALYVLGGCTINFTTIRYLVPLWVFVPTIFAAVSTTRDGPSVRRIAPLIACAAWAVGQRGLYEQVGRPHPLHDVAMNAAAFGIDPAVAEPLDAHLLSYLTGQRCRTAEFNSFWVRLPQFQRAISKSGPVDYIVQTTELDRERDWIDGGYPGESPPETRRFLWPALRQRIAREPGLVLLREPLTAGYEHFRLRHSLAESGNDLTCR